MVRTRRPALVLFLLFGAACSRAPQPAQPVNEWWQQAVIYQIYPRSFGDTNGDGVGDLNGITAHLDYLRDLGVDAIWITPFYHSPQVDFGYDISDYRNIDPQYGTLADFLRLVAEAQKRDIRVVADLVLNHTSDKHPWFLESRSSRSNPKGDWYVWRDGKPNHQPPNNWQSLFGGSAWQYDPQRGQYYYHEFYKEQPDLNWNNPDVRKAMYDVARFWMEHGVAGFRLDAISRLFEDPQLRDEPVLQPGRNAYGGPILNEEYTDNLPEVHDVLRELRRVTDEFPGRALIGETYLPNVQELLKMYGRNDDELQLPMDMQFGMTNHLSVSDFRARLREAEMEIHGHMPLLVFDNHDNRRSWNRYGDGVHDLAIAKLLAALLLTPRATALVYYGEEIGMENNDPKRREDVKDPIGRLGWPGEKGRDGERTPMQWNAGPHAGFSTAKATWLPVAPGYEARNVALEEKDPDSLLSFYKALIQLRRENPALHSGGFEPIDETNDNVLAYLRRAADGTTVLVALNLTGGPQQVSYHVGRGQATPLISTFAKAGDTADVTRLALPPYGVWVGQVE
ncbi:MAG: alpha-glucosidase [Bryobacteraceae bacterium]|jgi:alpha-glucosidase